MALYKYCIIIIIIITAFTFKSLQKLYRAKLQQNSRKSTQTGYQHLDIYHKNFPVNKYGKLLIFQSNFKCNKFNLVQKNADLYSTSVQHPNVLNMKLNTV